MAMATTMRHHRVLSAFAPIAHTRARSSREVIAGAIAAAGAALLGGSVHASSVAHASEGDGLELKHVIVFFRHGARAPLTENARAHDHTWSYCNEAKPFDPVSIAVTGLGGKPRPVCKMDVNQRKVLFPGGCHKGQLTSVGWMQARNLGSWLRERYVQRGPYSLVPGTFDADLVRVRTTNIARTIDTANGVLSGLFPGTPASSPIPIETASDDVEWLYPNPGTCPRLMSLVKDFKRWHQAASEEGQGEGTRGETRAKVRRAIEGPDAAVDPEAEPWGFAHMFDVSHSVLVHSGKHHFGMDDAILRELEGVAIEYMRGVVGGWEGNPHTKEQLALCSSRVVEDVLSGLSGAANGKHGRKMQLYSGHDTTLIPLLLMLGDALERWPPFASNLVIELYWCERLSSHVVKLIFNQRLLEVKPLTPALFVEATEGPEGVHVEGGAYYDLEDFAALLRTYTVADMAARCAHPQEEGGKAAKGGKAGVTKGAGIGV